MFKAGFYETEVTPPIGSFIPGHYAHVYGQGVKDRLYTKAVVIDNGDTTVAMAVLDCVEIPNGCHKQVVERVGAYTGIKPENITVASNHSHAGASTRSYPDIEAYSDQGYIDFLIKIMADCIILAFRRLEPVHISYACGKVYDISFNRNFVMRDGSITTNTGRDDSEVTELNLPDDIPVVSFEEAHNLPGAKIYNPNCVGNLAGIDPDVPVMFFRNQKGDMSGAIISFACHQTASGCREFSGDYASIISKELKKTYGNDFVSFFLIGAAGDINHIDFSKKELDPDVYLKMGKRLADEIRTLEQCAEGINDETLCARKEKLCIQRRKADLDSLLDAAANFVRDKSPARKMMLRNILVYEACGIEGVVDINVQCVRIGDVYLYALPGEMFVDFGLYIKENSPSTKNIITELANNDYGGYIPTKEVFHQNSSLYEKSLCEGSCLEMEAGYIISNKAIELAKQMQ